jgi:hypothetical protein
MERTSLTALKKAFDDWRSQKQHRSEPVPDGLLEQARVAALRHGQGPVSRVTKLDRRRLKHEGQSAPATLQGGEMSGPASTPAFSRVEVFAPVPWGRLLRSKRGRDRSFGFSHRLER